MRGDEGKVEGQKENAKEGKENYKDTKQGMRVRESEGKERGEVGGKRRRKNEKIC